MANHEINEDQDALTRALRMIETGDPVHADVYNALFSVLINNDVFLEKLANKMIQQAMISHVTDCTNPDMVMGADQGPVFTKLIEKIQEDVSVLSTNQKVRTVSESANLLTELYDLCSENRFTCFHVNNIRISNGYPIDSLNNGGATGIFINNEGHWGMILLFVQQPKTLYVGRISNKTIVGWREI